MMIIYITTLAAPGDLDIRISTCLECYIFQKFTVKVKCFTYIHTQTRCTNILPSGYLRNSVVVNGTEFLSFITESVDHLINEVTMVTAIVVLSTYTLKLVGTLAQCLAVKMSLNG